MTGLRLIVKHGPRKGEVFLMPDEGEITLGRVAENRIVFLDKAVSRIHCAFAREGDQIVLHDRESRNGVFVNEERTAAHTLAEGDEIRIGNIVLEVVGEDGTSVNLSPVSADDTGIRIKRVQCELEENIHPDPTVAAFLEAHASESAVKVISGMQVLWYSSAGAALFLLLNFDWLYFITIANFVFATFYIVTILYKLGTVMLAAVKVREVQITPEQLAGLKDDELPIYTLLVPLYKEPEVTATIIKAIQRLDYPEDKLDVKILLEADDKETLDVCKKGLPDFCEVIIVPDAQPRTKPRACNHGLALARGEHLVVYDAEDRPDPDQLRKAVAAFNAYPDIPCFQTKLNYYNQDQNLLTRWFTIEYSAWFDLFLPGLHRLGAPIPLGGTSNHFRTDILREVGGWDPFNVTEDADLGIRLYRRGHRTMVLDSTTWEEANSRLFNWIRQRSRWIKGYIQTHLVHMRHPVKLIRDLGLPGFFSFIFTVGGMAIMMLLNPLYWCAALLYGSLLGADLAAGRTITEVLSLPQGRDDYHAWQMIFNAPTDSEFWSMISIVFFAVTLALLISNLVFILINILGARRRKLKGMLAAILLSPLYWAFISIAAWKGFLQLFYKPFYWEKTVHGYYDTELK